MMNKQNSFETFPINRNREIWQQSEKSIDKVNRGFFGGGLLFSFVLKLGEIVAWLYADGNGPVEKEKKMLIQERGD